MRILSEVGEKLLSKLPKSQAEWIVDHLEKMTYNCNDGYAKLQSSWISRGRLTMTDRSDEKASENWSDQVWSRTGGSTEWPQALRPQRPEQLAIRGIKKSQRRKPPMNPNVDIFDPPVFLQIKDIKKAKEVKINRPSSPRQPAVVGGGEDGSPTWPVALLTFDKSVAPIDGPHQLTVL